MHKKHHLELTEQSPDKVKNRQIKKKEQKDLYLTEKTLRPSRFSPEHMRHNRYSVFFLFLNIILEYLKKHQPRHFSKELIRHFTVRIILFKKPPNVYKSTHTADLSFKKTTTTKNIDVSAC
jgi:hypothetical protein